MCSLIAIVGWIALALVLIRLLVFGTEIVVETVLDERISNWNGTGLDNLLQTVKLLQLEVIQLQNKVNTASSTGGNVSVWQYTPPETDPVMQDLIDNVFQKPKPKRRKRHGKSNTKIQSRRS